MQVQFILFVEVDFLWNRTVDSLKTSFHESLSSMNQQFCSRENQLLQMLQQNEKSTQFILILSMPLRKTAISIIITTEPI